MKALAYGLASWAFPALPLSLWAVIALNAAAFCWISLWLPIPLFSRWPLEEPNDSSSHRLHQAGWSHRHVASVYIVATAALAMT